MLKKKKKLNERLKSLYNDTREQVELVGCELDFFSFVDTEVNATLKGYLDE